MTKYLDFLESFNSITVIIRLALAALLGGCIGLEREKYKRGEIIYKIRIKNRLLPMVDKCKYRRLWWNTYPEVNKVILLGNKCYKPTYREWVWVFAIMTGLYPWQKKRLRSRRFRPLEEWI